MFENYPKTRPQLTEGFVKIYNEHYKSNREGGTNASKLSQRMESWLHGKVASDVEPVHHKKTLEIGAGTLNQMKYEQSGAYDIVEPFTELYSDSPYLSNVKTIYTDIEEIDISNRYERITSVATFEHICNLPEVVAKTCLLLDSKGSLRTGIPNEGTFLWKLGYQMTTGREFKKKYGYDYEILMKYEHVNTADEIEQVLRYFYKQNRCSVFGLCKRIGLYRFYVSTEPNVELAKEYLANLNQNK